MGGPRFLVALRGSAGTPVLSPSLRSRAGLQHGRKLIRQRTAHRFAGGMGFFDRLTGKKPEAERPPADAPAPGPSTAAVVVSRLAEVAGDGDEHIGAIAGRREQYLVDHK